MEADPLACAGCEAVYHRSCRLGAGKCVTEGCKRSKGLAPPSTKNDSALQMNVFPLVFGFFVGVAAGSIVGGGVFHLPLVGMACVALLVGAIAGGVAGGVAHQLWS